MMLDGPAANVAFRGSEVLETSRTIQRDWADKVNVGDGFRKEAYEEMEHPHFGADTMFPHCQELPLLLVRTCQTEEVHPNWTNRNAPAAGRLTASPRCRRLRPVFTAPCSATCMLWLTNCIYSPASRYFDILLASAPLRLCPQRNGRKKNILDKTMSNFHARSILMRSLSQFTQQFLF